MEDKLTERQKRLCSSSSHNITEAAQTINILQEVIRPTVLEEHGAQSGCRSERPSTSGNCASTSSGNDVCNCQKCSAPGHPCDCAKCQAKKEAHHQSSSRSRSIPVAREAMSCTSSAENFIPLLSSSQKFNESYASRRFESYRPSVPMPRYSETSRNSCSSNSTRYDDQSYNNRAMENYQPSSSAQHYNETGQPNNSNLTQLQGSYQSRFDDRPTTSTRMSCNTTTLTDDTRRSLMNTELNKTLFHPNSQDMLKRSNYSSIDQLYSPKDNESLLIEDTYQPGLIEDCVAGRKDFNAVSFGMFFENTQQIPKSMPEKTPMTLLEAIYKRIDVEREHMSDALNCKSNFQPLNVASIDLYFSCKPQTELNEALASLFKAQTLYNEANPENQLDQVEKDEATYDIEIKHAELPLVGGCPITVECFTGTTKLKQIPSKEHDLKRTERNEGPARRNREDFVGKI